MMFYDFQTKEKDIIRKNSNKDKTVVMFRMLPHLFGYRESSIKNLEFHLTFV